MFDRFVAILKMACPAAYLEHVPSGVERLTSLGTLMLHKNSIREVSTIVFPRQLQRLSLYRNRIASGCLELSHLERISEVNLGANPLESLTLRLAENVHDVSLGVRHVREAAEKVRCIR